MRVFLITGLLFLSSSMTATFEVSRPTQDRRASAHLSIPWNTFELLSDWEEQADFWLEDAKDSIRNFWARFSKDYEEVHDELIDSYFANLIEELRLALPEASRQLPCRVVVGIAIMPNAWAYPDGMILIDLRYLVSYQNEDALVALIAHEIAHLVFGHGVSNGKLRDSCRIEEDLLKRAIEQAGADERRYRLLSELLEKRRDQNRAEMSAVFQSRELEADVFALQLVLKAGYNPEAMLTRYERLSLSDKPARELCVQTHPPHLVRLQRIAQELAFAKEAPLSYPPVRQSERFCAMIERAKEVLTPTVCQR